MFYGSGGGIQWDNTGRAQPAAPHEDSLRHTRFRKVDHSQRSFVSIIISDPAHILSLDDPYRSIFALTDA
jgi:hypothetical protein